MMLIRDLRYAFRMLRKDSAFSIVAVLSLALGTGANSTMFSLVNAMLLRPLTVSRPAEVLTISPKAPSNPFDGVSYPDYLDFRDRSRTMTDLVACALFRFGFSPTPDALPRVKYGLLVSGNLFEAMGVTPILGRAFRADEDQVPGRDAVVVLGHDFWKDEFGGDRGVVGRIVRLNGLDFTVIGVAPETFTGMDEFFKATMFVPARMAPRFSTDPERNLLVTRDLRDFTVKGRLVRGADAVQAEAELVSIAKGLEDAYPATNAGQSVALRTELQMHIQHLPRESGFMIMAMIMAGLVLLTSCFNVANLLMSRTRSREVAVRLAMGARRSRLVRQLLTESLVLGIAGSLAGLWFAWAAARVFNRIRVPSDLPFIVDVQSDHRVLLFSLAAGFLSVMFFGLIPALQGSKVNLVSALKSTDDAAAGKRSLWGRNLLVVAQLAISVVLLIVSTMLYSGFSEQLSAGAGFRTNDILMMTFDPRMIQYKDDQIKEFYRRLVEQTALVPGVKSVSMAVTLPFAINQRAFAITAAREDDSYSKEDKDKESILYNVVDDRFLDTLGIPIGQGRSFELSDDADAPRVVVVNEVLAENFWPGESAVHKRLQLQGDDGRMELAEVVGVARTSKYVWMTEAPTAYLYLPLSQNHRRQRIMVVQSHGDAATLTGTLRELVQGLDSNMPIFDVRTMEEYVTTWVIGSVSVTLYIIGAMGLTGLVLAVIGLYGLVAYSVSRRTREFGIRMAVGASKASILAMVLRQGTMLCLTGLAIGMAASVPAARLLNLLVFGANENWFAYMVVPILLLVVTLLATYGPARRASTIDPMNSLRNE